VTLGQSIRQARLDAGMSLEAVAERTRVRPGIVQALEDDDLTASGGPVYARGHIRAIATAVGADPGPWLAELDSGLDLTPPPTVALGALEERPPRHGPNWTAAMAAVLAVLVGLVGWQYLSDGDGGTDVATTPLPTASATTSPQPSEPVPSTPAPLPSEPVASAPLPDGVVVVVSATATSWISGTQGAEAAYEGLMAAGETREFTDDERVRLVIGNAGAVELTVNGRDLGAPGADGEVVRLTFGPGEPSLAAG
jgi:cytoskeleton protein RodZ